MLSEKQLNCTFLYPSVTRNKSKDTPTVEHRMSVWPQNILLLNSFYWTKELWRNLLRIICKIFLMIWEGRNRESLKANCAIGRQSRAVRRAAIEKVEDSIDLAELMVNTFTATGAVPVTIEILQAIGCNEQATELKENTGKCKENYYKIIQIQKLNSQGVKLAYYRRSLSL